MSFCMRPPPGRARGRRVTLASSPTARQGRTRNSYGSAYGLSPRSGAGGHPHDRFDEFEGAGGAEERGVAEGEDPAVGGDQPVAGAGRRWRQPDDGSIELQGAGGAEEAGVAEGEDAAVGGDEP